MQRSFYSWRHLLELCDRDGERNAVGGLMYPLRIVMFGSGALLIGALIVRAAQYVHLHDRRAQCIAVGIDPAVCRERITY